VKEERVVAEEPAEEGAEEHDDAVAARETIKGNRRTDRESSCLKET
jgi:hypothetical protein